MPPCTCDGTPGPGRRPGGVTGGRRRGRGQGPARGAGTPGPGRGRRARGWRCWAAPWPPPWPGSAGGSSAAGSARSTAGRPTGPRTSLTGLLVDNRVLPVFALLLGYGVAVRLAPDARTPRATGRAGHAPPDEAELGVGAAPRGRAARARRAARRPVPPRGRPGRARGDAAAGGAARPRPDARTHVLVGVLAVPALLVHGAVDGFGGTLGFPDAPQDYLLSVVDRVGTWLLGLVLRRADQRGPARRGRARPSGWPARAGGGTRPGTGGACGSSGPWPAVVGLLGAVPYARVLGAGRLPDVVVGLWAGVLDAVTGPVGRARRGAPASCSRRPGPPARRPGVPAQGAGRAAPAGATEPGRSTSRTRCCWRSSSRPGRAGRAAGGGARRPPGRRRCCGRSPWGRRSWRPGGRLGRPGALSPPSGRAGTAAPRRSPTGRRRPRPRRR